MQDRLASLRVTTGALTRDRSELMERLGRSLLELRSQRSRLLGGRAPGRSAGGSLPEQLTATFGFTRREAEVALLLAAGNPNAIIAEALGISEHTARHHTRHVLVKLGVHSRARAAAVVLRELGADAVPVSDLPPQLRALGTSA